ncbi:MAG: MFS transporter [Candidatus Anaerobiospirillum merdipullorum]|uniref:MFS transporter n=1 Tax=Candidatus Anaerobiospirillum merdipullorum TaxID=2838450 RepID=A0A9E2KP43_9GAMM|nr:MFS transporter [Candidatus Anaerobiospirillum merdipullorum]
MIRGLIALSFGALSYGITEFVVMGLLPFIAADFMVSTATAGHTISAYALGVVVGAFFMVFLRKMRLKHLLVLVISIHFAANILTYFAPSFNVLILCRLLAGLPHGCFFGVGAIVAQRLATKGKGNSAMAIMIAGQTMSNVFGVPLGTMLANYFSWRAIFALLTIWSAIVLLTTISMLPDTGKLEDKGFWQQFAFLKRVAPWLVLGMIFFGSAGMFCVQTYVSPLLTDLGGLALIHVSVVLAAAGIAMMISNLLSGWLSDKFTPVNTATGYFLVGIAAMIVLVTLGHYLILCVGAILLIAAVLFGVSTPDQVLMVRTSKGGELLGVAMGQVGFNAGNAIGALVGGVPIEKGLTLNYVPAVGLIFMVAACGCVLMLARKRQLVPEA